MIFTRGVLRRPARKSISMKERNGLTSSIPRIVQVLRSNIQLDNTESIGGVVGGDSQTSEVDSLMNSVY